MYLSAVPSPVLDRDLEQIPSNPSLHPFSCPAPMATRQALHNRLRTVISVYNQTPFRDESLNLQSAGFSGMNAYPDVLEYYE